MKKFLFLALLGLSLSVAVSAKGNRGGSSRGGSSHKGAHYTNRSGGHTYQHHHNASHPHNHSHGGHYN